ncbi:MAG: UDP-3-O-(3-hydroxymyristoyl)glucosamine N-acyltransferase [Armatimonadota bacterium]
MKEMPVRTVGELAAHVHGLVTGDPETVIRGIASIEDARSGDITFAESLRYLENACSSSASAILAPRLEGGVRLSPDVGIGNKVLIEVDNPRLAFTLLLDLFAPERYADRAIHPTAVLGSDVRIGRNVLIGAHAVIGDHVRLGDNATIHALAFVGDDVEVGEDSVVHPNATLLHGTIVGARTIIHSGAVLGADGFGYLTQGGRHRKVPQIGHVRVGDDVEIGANVTIDRAKTGATRIGDGTKIDNQVHVGHNCQIGENVLLVAQVGLAGGVEVGDGAILAGKAGVKEQLSIGAGAVVGAASVVLKDIPAKQFVSGIPARPHKENLRAQAAAARTPDLMRAMRDLERRIAELERGAGPEGHR